MDATSQERFRPIIRKRLDAIEAELAVTAESTEPISPDASIGRLSRLDSIQMQQMALAAQRRLEEERGRLQEGISRIDSGKFGTCLLCGGEISVERLEFQPDAVACMPCMNRRK